MYPRPDRPLVPKTLQEAIGSVSVPARLARRFDLDRGLVLGDFSAAIVAGMPEQAVDAVAALVVAAVSRIDLKEVASDILVPSGPIPIERLDLTRRTRNALIGGRFIREGNLLPTSLHTLSRGWTIGPVALLDILTEVERYQESPQHALVAGSQNSARLPAPSAAVRAAVEPFLSRPWGPNIHQDDPRLGKDLELLHPQAHTAREAGELLWWAPVEPAAEPQLTKRIQTFVKRADQLSGVPLETELLQIVDAMVPFEQSRDVVARRLGLGGTPPMTYEAAGRRTGVTRERVRQVVQTFTNAVGSRSAPWTPALDRALQTVTESLPCTSADLVTRLQEAGISHVKFSVDSLRAAARLFGRDLPAVTEGSWLYREGQARPRDIASAARRLITHWGVTTIETLLSSLEDQKEPPSEAMVIHVIEALPGFKWLDDEEQWFWIRDLPRNRLLNQVEKIVAVAGSIELADLRNGVGRHHRMEGFRPPRRTLAAVCVDSGFYRQEATRIVGGASLPDWRVVLSDLECGLVELLFDRGPVMRKDELMDLAINERGFNRNSVTVYLTYSPVLERYAPGVWGLRGAPVTAAQIQALIPPRVRHQVLQDHGWTRDGKLWVAYRLSPAAVESGVLGTPAAFRGVASGSFALFAEGSQAVGNLVIESNMWGLSPFFRRWGLEPGDHLVIALDLRERRATIVAGAEDLLLRYQRGE